MSAPEATGFALTVITKGTECVQCGATERALKKKGLHPDVHYSTLDANVEENRQIGLELNYMQAPVLLVVDAEGQLVDSWSGFNPGKINEWSQKVAAPAEQLLAA